MSEREEIMRDLTGNEWGVALMGKEIMIVDFDWGEGAVDFEEFNSEEDAEKAFEQVRQGLESEGDPWIYVYDESSS